VHTHLDIVDAQWTLAARDGDRVTFVDLATRGLLRACFEREARADGQLFEWDTRH